jgi:hypothetical protein
MVRRHNQILFHIPGCGLTNWAETFISDALKDSKLQNWQRFIAYNLKVMKWNVCSSFVR